MGVYVKVLDWNCGACGLELGFGIVQAFDYSAWGIIILTLIKTILISKK